MDAWDRAAIGGVAVAAVLVSVVLPRLGNRAMARTRRRLYAGLMAWAQTLPKESEMTETPETTEKPQLTGLFRDDPATAEGKYLVQRRDGTTVEWPSFVIGARDPHAPAALREYARNLDSMADPANDAFVDRVMRLADEFDAYRAEHGDGDPTRGRHRKDDPDTVRVMRGEPRRVYLVWLERAGVATVDGVFLRRDDAVAHAGHLIDLYNAGDDVEVAIDVRSADGAGRTPNRSS